MEGRGQENPLETSDFYLVIIRMIDDKCIIITFKHELEWDWSF